MVQEGKSNDSTAARWFTAVPHVYTGEPVFWNRDAGALCLAFRKLGIDSRFVAYGPGRTSGEEPIELCSPAEMENASWWQQWKLRGVVLTSWAAPRYEPIARAIKQSGAILIMRMDSDGLKSPRQDFWRFLYFQYYFHRDNQRKLPLFQAVGKTLAFRLFPTLYEKPMLRHFEHADIILIESPLAREALARFFCTVGRSHLVSRLRMVSWPARGEVRFDPASQKQKQIIAVGRWQTCQKDAPTLLQVLRQALVQQVDYTAFLVGPGEQLLAKLMQDLPTSVKNRIRVCGSIPFEEVQKHYQTSQVILFTSRFEGFPFAASEALLAGCTLVGPGTIPAFNYICSLNSGSASLSRRPHDLADALMLEIGKWTTGERNPFQLSDFWQRHLSETAVAKAILQSGGHQVEDLTPSR